MLRLLATQTLEVGLAIRQRHTDTSGPSTLQTLNFLPVTAFHMHHFFRRKQVPQICWWLPSEHKINQLRSRSLCAQVGPVQLLHGDATA